MASELELLPNDIEDRLQRLPNKVSGTEGLDALWLFGSFARWEATPVSDVDIAYLRNRSYKKVESERWETDLYLTISGALHTDKFTFMNLRRAPVFVAWRVLNEGQLLVCNNDKAVCDFREGVFNRFPDISSYRKERLRAVYDWVEGKNMKIDKDRVYHLLGSMREEMQFLKDAEKMSLEEYLEAPGTQRIVERCLQRAIEAGISIGNHISSRLGFRSPQNYADIFQVLKEKQVLPRDIADRFSDMAKLRNLLVHVYWDIDQKRLHNSLTERIETLRAFCQNIGQWLEENGESIGT